MHGNVDHQKEQVPRAPAVQQTQQAPSSNRMPSESLAEVLAESRAAKSSFLQTNNVAAKAVPQQWAGVSASMVEDFTNKASPQPVRAPYPVSAEIQAQDLQSKESESIPPSLPKVPIRSSQLQPTQWTGISASLVGDWTEGEAPASAPAPVGRNLEMPEAAHSEANTQGKDWDVSSVPALHAARPPSNSLDSAPLPWTGVSSALADEYTMVFTPSPPKRRFPPNRDVGDEPMQAEQRPRETSNTYVADYTHAKPSVIPGVSGQIDSYHDFSPLSII